MGPTARRESQSKHRIPSSPVKAVRPYENKRHRVSTTHVLTAVVLYYSGKCMTKFSTCSNAQELGGRETSPLLRTAASLYQIDLLPLEVQGIKVLNLDRALEYRRVSLERGIWDLGVFDFIKKNCSDPDF